LIAQLPLKPLEKLRVLGVNASPQAAVVAAGAVIIGSAAGATVIVLCTDATVLPQTSVAVHVSVTSPPHAPGVVENVDSFEVPLIAQLPLKPLEKLRVLGVNDRKS